MQDRIRTIEKDLDLNNNFLVNCNCKQYDTIKFIFNMFMDGEVADLSDCIFRLQAKKGDGLPYINNNSDNISVIGNIVTIDNDNQLTARAGDTFAEVVITDKNGHMKTTFDIRLNIKSSAIDGLINSEATITILDSLEEKLNKVDNIGTVLEEANTTEKSLNNLIPTGNILKDNLDSIIGTGSTLKNDLDTVVQSSSTLKDNLDSVNTLAEHNIEELNKLGDVTDLAIQVQTNTNNISDLEADKTDILNAIGNAELQTTDKTIKGAINENKSDIGDIETLTTDDKTNLVKAVNEHEVQINNNTTSLNQKVNKSDIVDNLSSTEEGKVLSARQGKQLADKLEKEIILETIPSVTGAYNDDNNYHPRAFINGNSVNIQGLVYISSINSDLTLFNNVPVCKYQGWRKVFGYDNDNNFNVFINPNGTITGTPKIVGTYIFDFSYIKA